MCVVLTLHGSTYMLGFVSFGTDYSPRASKEDKLTSWWFPRRRCLEVKRLSEPGMR